MGETAYGYAAYGYVWRIWRRERLPPAGDTSNTPLQRRRQPGHATLATPRDARPATFGTRRHAWRAETDLYTVAPLCACPIAHAPILRWRSRGSTGARVYTLANTDPTDIRSKQGTTGHKACPGRTAPLPTSGNLGGGLGTIPPTNRCDPPSPTPNEPRGAHVGILSQQDSMPAGLHACRNRRSRPPRSTPPP